MGWWRRPRLGRAFGPCLALSVIVRGALAQDAPPEPLRFTVRPSFSESEETLDEKLARRDRSFRFICIGCVHADGRIDMAPFSPLATLGRPIPIGREMFGVPETAPEPAGAARSSEGPPERLPAGPDVAAR